MSNPRWYFDGWLAEMTIFDRTLTENEIEAVETYLAEKFDLDIAGS